MGQKVNPIGFRLAVRRDWKSRWYAKGKMFSQMVIEDASARRFIEREYAQAMVSKIEIERTLKNVRLIIHSARPGVIIGKKGEDIDKLRAKLRRVFSLQEVSVDIKEINQPETDAKLIAMNIATQLEKRVMFRRAIRRAMTNAMRLKIDGIKIMSAGRLNGIEIARSEWYREGRVPLHTLKNDIDYGYAVANTAMGTIGIKVWVSKGDKYGVEKKAKYTLDDVAAKDESAAEAEAEATEAAEAERPAAQDDGVVAESAESAEAPEAAEDPEAAENGEAS